MVINLKMGFVPFFLFCCLILSAQRAVEEKKVKYLFPEGDIHWIRYYESTGMSMPGSTLSIGFDGAFCKGVLTHNYTAEQFTVKGTIKKDSFLLEEFDANKNKTGTFKGLISATHVEGVWKGNQAGDIGMKLYFDAANPSDNQLKNCRDNHLVKIGIGKVGARSVNIILQQIENQKFIGQLSFGEPTESFTISGSIAEKAYKVKATPNDKKEKVEFDLIEIAPKQYQGEWKSQNGKKETISLQFQEDFKLFCIEFSDYSSTYLIALPLGKAGSPFNKWSQEIFDRNFKQIQQQMRDLKTEYPISGPENRAAIRLSMWCEVTFYASDLVSGILHSNTGKQSIERHFVFDNKLARELAIDDIVKNKDKLILQIAAQVEKSQQPSKAALEGWLAKQNFEKFSVCAEGLLFSCEKSDKMTIAEVLVPFSAINSNLKSGTAVLNHVK
ncbi:MAG: hypothetical protein ACOYOA_04855 [Saprospiraceae bacterium]